MNPRAEGLRSFVRGAYDMQKLRIAEGNRLAANFYSKLGIKPGESVENAEKEDGAFAKDAAAKKVLNIIKKEYELLSEGIATGITKKKFEKLQTGTVISTFTEYCLVNGWITLMAEEKKHFARLESLLEDFPIWTEYLADVRGCGPATAGVIVSEIDIHKAKHASNLWKYAGLDVAPDGYGRSKRSEHLIKTKYTDSKGEEHEKSSITYSPFLKTKLMGVLAGSFLKSGNERYRAVYDGYKNRMENHAKWGIEAENNWTGGADDWRDRPSKIRRHNQSLRYMMKIFLLDLYVKWRELEGLEVSKPYSEAKLGMPPHGNIIIEQEG